MGKDNTNAFPAGAQFGGDDMGWCELEGSVSREVNLILMGRKELSASPKKRGGRLLEKALLGGGDSQGRNEAGCKNRLRGENIGKTLN